MSGDSTNGREISFSTKKIKIKQLAKVHSVKNSGWNGDTSYSNIGGE